MSADDRVYLIRNSSDEKDGADAWISPKPAETVIINALVEATDIAAEDIDGLESYVDIAALHSVVGNGTDEEITFTVESHEVTVTHNGDVEVEA